MTVTTPPILQRWGIGLRAIAWFVLCVLFLLALPVVLVWPYSVLTAIAVLALLLALLPWLIRRYWARGREGYSAGRSYAWIGTGTVMALVAFPVYYLANLVDTRPTAVPQVVLSDGKKTVVFQGMVHVGSEGFYKAVFALGVDGWQVAEIAEPSENTRFSTLGFETSG